MSKRSSRPRSSAPQPMSSSLPTPGAFLGVTSDLGGSSGAPPMASHALALDTSLLEDPSSPGSGGSGSGGISSVKSESAYDELRSRKEELFGGVDGVDVSTFPANASTPRGSTSGKSFFSKQDAVLHLRGTKRKLVIAMVGLPARGKSYTGRKLCRYLNWLCYNCEVFNIGSYRRALYGADAAADFFSSNNEAGMAARTQCAVDALDDMFSYLRTGGHAAVYDGTNSTVQRRNMIIEYVKRQTDLDVELMWVESICEDMELIERNIRDTKLTSPDYANMDPDAAVRDFRARIRNYEKVYEPVNDPRQSWVKMVNAGRQLVSNRIYGYLPTRIVFFLMNLRLNKSPIYLTRHGESQFNVVGRIGGDASLTERGRMYAERMAAFIADQEEVKARPDGIPVWTSCLKRTIETAEYVTVAAEKTQWRALNEIDSGTMDGMTYAEIEHNYPEEFAARQQDKLCYRYPQGESYVDLITRQEPVIFELERLRSPVLVVAHQAVLRATISYFQDLQREEVPFLSVPLHTVIKLTPRSYGAQIEYFQFDIAANDPQQP